MLAQVTELSLQCIMEMNECWSNYPGICKIQAKYTRGLSGSQLLSAMINTMAEFWRGDWKEPRNSIKKNKSNHFVLCDRHCLRLINNGCRTEQSHFMLYLNLSKAASFPSAGACEIQRNIRCHENEWLGNY